MKKKVVMMVVTMAMAAAMMTGCGAKGDTASQTTQESQHPRSVVRWMK